MKNTNYEGDCAINLHLEADDEGAFFTRPTRVSLYFFRTQEALEATFLPLPREKDEEWRPGLGRVYLQDDYDYYQSAGEGIHLTDASWRGVAEVYLDMLDRGTLRDHFRPCAPASFRWSQLPLRELALPPALERYRNKLAQFYSAGEVVVKYLQAENADEFMNCRRHQGSHMSCFRTELLRNPALSSLSVFESANYLRIADADWRAEDRFHLEATLASKIYWGGACSGYRPDHGAAQQLAVEVCEALWGQSYDGMIVGHSCSELWSRWFHGIAWDWTLIAPDYDKGTVLCLFATDVD